MIKEAICTGETVDEAKEKALEELGADLEDDVQIEVLATPKKKALGIFGGSPAKVRVYVEVPEKEIKETKHEQKKHENPKQKPSKAEKPVKAEKEEVKESEKSEENNLPPAVDSSEIPADSGAGRAVKYIETILKGLGCEDIKITVQVLENSAVLNLEGEGLGVVIGRRGETLDALQYLTSLAANSGAGYFRITLNIGNYREKREATLRALAKRMSSQVLRTGRPRSLEPMNPYERRIIHTTVQGINGVTSASAGEGDARHVVIRPERSAERSGNYGHRRSERPSAPVSDPNREALKDHGDVTLYSKIN